jgi:hypothetical protein
MNRTTLARSIAAALIGSAVLMTAVPASAQPYGEGQRGPRMSQMTEADRAQMRERMQARVNQRLDRLAARLEIKASQQGAWEAYRNTVTSAFQARPQRPARDADAATLMRFRAERAQYHAQRLVSLADATAKLHAALEPAQQKVLDEVVRQIGQRGMRGGRGEGARRASHFQGGGHRHHDGGHGAAGRGFGGRI